MPLGWALYLPEEWCDDPERRRKAKIPDEVGFQTKPELGGELVERAAGWEIAQAPVLGDEAYGDDSSSAHRLDEAGLEYVLVGLAPGRGCSRRRRPVRGARADASPARPAAEHRPRPTGAARGRRRSLAAAARRARGRRCPAATGPGGEEITLAVRVRARRRRPPRHNDRLAAARGVADHRVAREATRQPSDYWLSNLPADSPPERLARLARLRWTIELDYRQLKGELGLDHYEGRSYLGFHHHTALVTCAHAFLTLERLDPKPSGRPDTPPGSAAAPARLQVLDRPLHHLPADDRPRRPTPSPPAPTRVTTYQSPTKGL